MTFFTTDDVAAHRVRIPNLRAPTLIFGRNTGGLLKACGRGLSDATRAYAQALELAYVKPGSVPVEKPRLILDADGEGRDPNW